jgi:DNA-binding transcriptional regulator YdaS (Cro superfamily)
MKTDDAIHAFGSIKELAAALGITQPAIYQWGDDVPPLRAYQISEIMASRAAEQTDQKAA